MLNCFRLLPIQIQHTQKIHFSMVIFKSTEMTKMIFDYFFNICVLYSNTHFFGVKYTQDLGLLKPLYNGKIISLVEFDEKLFLMQQNNILTFY